MWWHDVRGFAEAAIVDQASGSHFDTPVIPMAHLHFVVEDDVLEKVVGLIRDEIEGDGYEDECLVVMDAVHEMKPGTVASIG
jgi:nitrogen regulatory protein PII